MNKKNFLIIFIILILVLIAVGTIIIFKENKESGNEQYSQLSDPELAAKSLKENSSTVNRNEISQLDLCKQEKDVNFKDFLQKSKNFEFAFLPVLIYGKINMPQLQANFSNFKINYGIFDVSSVHSDGTFCLIANKEQSGGVLISITSSDDTIFYYTIIDPQEGQSIVIDSKTTAASLIYLTPGVPSNKSNEARIIFDYIYGIPKISDLAKIISDTILLPNSSLENLYESDIFLTIQNEIIQSLIQKIKNCGGIVEGCNK